MTNKTMRKNIMLLLALLVCRITVAQITDYSIFDKKLNFYIVNDMGRNGYYDQKSIAGIMGAMAEEIGPEFVLATGDIHHFDGVQSTSDPLWVTNYEAIYSHPELMTGWYPVLGNHEYRGNTQAVLDYSGVSRRWNMPARYYTRRFQKKDFTIRVVWIDTTPLISRYREENDEYPDACMQNADRQLEWIDSVLTAATEDWLIVAGHHPVYAETSKDDSERGDMQARLDPILRRHCVDMYVNGHIHNFQHIRVSGSGTDYVTNSAGALSRKVKPVEGTVFCSSEPGFSIVSADKNTLCLYMIDRNGNIIHSITRSKRCKERISK